MSSNSKSVVKVTNPENKEKVTCANITEIYLCVLMDESCDIRSEVLSSSEKFKDYLKKSSNFIVIDAYFRPRSDLSNHYAFSHTDETFADEVTETESIVSTVSSVASVSPSLLKDQEFEAKVAQIIRRIRKSPGICKSLTNPFRGNQHDFIRRTVVYNKLTRADRVNYGLTAKKFHRYLWLNNTFTVKNNYVELTAVLKGKEKSVPVAKPSNSGRKRDICEAAATVLRFCQSLEATSENAVSEHNPFSGYRANFFKCTMFFNLLPPEAQELLQSCREFRKLLLRRDDLFLTEGNVNAFQSVEYLKSRKCDETPRKIVSGGGMEPKLTVDKAILSLISLNLPMTPTQQNSKTMYCKEAGKNMLFYKVSEIHRRIMKFAKASPKTIDGFKEYLVYNPKFVLNGNFVRARATLQSTAEKDGKLLQNSRRSSQSGTVRDLAIEKAIEKMTLKGGKWISYGTCPTTGQTKPGFELYVILRALELPDSEWFEGNKDFKKYLQRNPEKYTLLGERVFNTKKNLVGVECCEAERLDDIEIMEETTFLHDERDGSLDGVQQGVEEDGAGQLSQLTLDDLESQLGPISDDSD